MVLRFFRELSHEEIANELNIEKGNVWYKIKKGRELLKKKSELNGIF
jgi:DNA-directed RNA polymerase specialized sigma24 family protein